MEYSESFYERANAQEWAEAFNHIRTKRMLEDNVDIASDIDTMLGWFANAFQAGEWASKHYKEWVDKIMTEVRGEDGTH